MRNWGSYKSASTQNYSIDIDECLEENIYEISIKTQNWYLRYTFQKLSHLNEILDFLENLTQEKIEVKTEKGNLVIWRDDEFQDRFFIDLEKESCFVKLTLLNTDFEFQKCLKKIIEER